MSFYQAMQLPAANLKPLIKNAEDKKLKKKFITALIIKNFLCILFCMALVTYFSNVFGNDNSIVGVVTVVSLMTFRFSNLDFKTGQSTIAILVIFAIFIISPYLATVFHPIIGSIINFISMMIIIVLSCHNTVLSNQSTLILSYLLLYGYKINDINGYINRAIALILGGIIVAVIFYYKHRKVNFNNSFKDIMKDIDFSTARTKWQLKLALGTTIAILIGELLYLPRVMWIAFACNSILQPDAKKIEERLKVRYRYVIIGCLLFAIMYIVLPQEYRGYIGIIGGIMVGFSATYSWQTSFNCFGALTAAVPVFGLWWAIVIRIIANIFAAMYSMIFNNIFNKIDEKFYNNDDAIAKVG